MYNNASYRRFNVSGTTSFTFTPAEDSVLMSPAVTAWTGATINPIEPVPGIDGRAFIAFKVTNPSAGVWHYEYALYNMNLDRAIQSFSVPLGCGITLSNIGFHAPPNHPGFPNDGTVGGAGFSNAAWTSNQTIDALSWGSETFAQNQNANAIRWGTLYNFRFDSDKPPRATNATIGFFKTGSPVTVAILGPNACDVGPTPSPTPTPTPTASPSPSPSATPSPTPSPSPGARAVNLSTRLRAETGDNVPIGGFIVTGTQPKKVIVRAIGPSLNVQGVPIPGRLENPTLELVGPGGTIATNDNWRTGGQEAEIIASTVPPTNDLESAIVATLPANGSAYTAIVRGVGGATGISLVEIYDLDSSANSQLANISTRGFVETGDNVMIGGLILAGSAPRRIIVRAIGPSLNVQGVPVPGRLQDTSLSNRRPERDDSGDKR